MVGEAGALDGRRIVLGVAGGIAAYKAVEICRRMVDAGAHVVPVLTEAATRFVAPLTFSALASEPAQLQLWGASDPIPHTRLGQGADLIVIAPATADVLARYAHGLADDLLTATLLATRAPVLIAPAMHTEMWEHPAVQDNLALLRTRGVAVVGPATGRLAGGDQGAGRLADPDQVLEAAERLLAVVAETGAGGPAATPRGTVSDLRGVRVLVSAGGTREPIDPVRFIGNRSSGKQGHAVAAEAAARGATVVLVTASDLPGPAGAEIVRVQTAAEMEAALTERIERCDVVVMAAAVADFRPASAAAGKIHRAEGPLVLELEPTSDILAGLSRRRRPGQVLVGFAAETEDTLEHAAAKLASKGVDLVVANDVTLPGVGFEGDTNAVAIIGREGLVKEVPLSSKGEVAAAVLDVAASLLPR